MNDTKAFDELLRPLIDPLRILNYFARNPYARTLDISEALGIDYQRDDQPRDVQARDPEVGRNVHTLAAEVIMQGAGGAAIGASGGFSSVADTL